jgi:hypothetical protein
MTQNFLRRAPSGKLKTAATAAFLGVCARYRQKPAICCADDTIGGGGALIREPPAGNRDESRAEMRKPGALRAGPIRLNAN